MSLEREQSPIAVFHYPLHEQVGNPVGRIHIVGTAAVITGVLAQFEKLFNVEVPGFEVGATGTAAFAPWFTATSWSLCNLRKGMTPCDLTVGALDEATGAADGGP